MKHIIQFVDHRTGIRSEPFHVDFDELKAKLQEQEIAEQIEYDDYILLVATCYEDAGEEQMMIPRAPLIKIATFLGKEEETEEEYANHG